MLAPSIIRKICAICVICGPAQLTLPRTELAAQTKRSITAEDYFLFKTPADPRLSPDGKLVAYTVTRVDKTANRRQSSIWLTSTDGSGVPRQLTASHLSSSAPRWRPDGKAILFSSARPIPGDDASARPQAYLLDLAGGEPRRVTTLQNGATGCDWSPDGTRLACLSRTGPSDRKPFSSDVRHYTGLTYKSNDTGWFDDKRSHIHVIDAATGKSTQVTSGDGWNDTEPQWSPDGSRIAFVSNRTGKEENGDEDDDVWIVPATGGNPVLISDKSNGSGAPRWHPDGQTILYTARVGDGAPPSLFTAPAAGNGTSTLIFEGTEYYPGDVQWTEGGKAIWFATGHHGETHYYRLDPATRRVTPITRGARAVRGLAVNPAAALLVYTSNDFQRPDEIFTARLDATGERRLTYVNDSLFATLDPMPVERMTYKGADGWDVDGFLVKPVGWVAGRQYPMILTIHGGPAGMYGVDWFHEFQVYAAKGWAVFFTNPRGSTGYGHKFNRGIELEWGGKDYIDVMNGVDAILAANPWIDQTRLGVTGGSYGGFLTNWIVGHTDRFKAAVTLRSVTNFISDEGTRDGAYGHKDDFRGDLFQKFDLYWDRSPLKYVQNVTTPILVLHSDNDLRVPLEQGEQWFRALRYFNKTAEFVIFPRENHNLTRTGEPKHLVESMEWQLYWFDKYLMGKGDAVPPSRR